MDDEINLNPYIASIWRWKWFILIVTALAGLVIAYSEWKPATYTASALIQVGKVWKEPLEDLYTTSELINSDGFRTGLAAKLGRTSDRLQNELHAETITVGPPKSSHPILVRVSAGAGSYEESARLVQAAADEVISRHQNFFDRGLAPHLEHQRQLESAVAAGGRSADDTVILLAALDEVKSNNVSPSITEKTHVDSNVMPGPVTKPALLRPAITAGLIAGLISLFVVVTFNRAFQAVRTSDTLNAPEQRAATPTGQS